MIPALLAAAACRDEPGAGEVVSGPASTASPASTVAAGTAVSAVVAPSNLPSELPRIAGRVESAVEAEDGALAVVWAVDAPPGEIVEALAQALAAARLDRVLDERNAGGGILGFEGARLSGHYLVTSHEEQTRVELRLDPPPPPAAAPATAVPLPDGYPEDLLPVYPGAVVTSARAEQRPGGGTRFTVTLQTERHAVEVLGFYRDLLTVDGWLLSAREDGARGLEAGGPRGSLSIVASEGPRAAAMVVLDVP